MNNKQLKALLGAMSTQEKLAQLTQLAPFSLDAQSFSPLTGPDIGLRVPPHIVRSIGSILNCGSGETMIALQKKHLSEDPHKIPLLFMADIIHGFKTIFPIPLACSCSFMPSVIEESCSIAALESAVSGIHITFSPMSDLVRDPRWGRVLESFGEDPYLNAVFSRAAVLGYQGESPASKGKIASCVKHFAAYGIPEGGREYNSVELSEDSLWDTFLSGYKAAIDAGAKLVMSSFNIVNRIPATGNVNLLQKVLRKELHFDGVVISDFNSIGELINHGTAEDGFHAALLGMNAGVDIEMMSTHYISQGEALLSWHKMEEAVLDEAVLRVLLLKNEMHLFENPYKDADISEEARLHLCKKHRDAAKKAAEQCPVLLKNQNVLPLNASDKIGLVGPFACSHHVLGAWSAGNSEGVSLYEGLCNRMPQESICLGATEELGSLLDGILDIPKPTPYAPSTACGFEHERKLVCKIEDCTLLEQLAECETVIVAVGEHQADTGEGASKTNLRLSPNQEALIHILKEAGKKIITVVFSGRPMELLPITEDSDAILQAWFLGTESGNALADILLGLVNPSGRLTMSFPQTVGQIPVYYNHYNTGRPLLGIPGEGRYLSRYLDCPNDPLYPFGYGLSYSDFEYTDFKISVKEVISASVIVSNRSQAGGYETVQFYIRDICAPVVRPVKSLRGFQKIYLQPGESREVSFTVVKDMLTFYQDGAMRFEPGQFTLAIGRNASDTLWENIQIEDSLFPESSSTLEELSNKETIYARQSH